MLFWVWIMKVNTKQNNSLKTQLKIIVFEEWGELEDYCCFYISLIELFK